MKKYSIDICKIIVGLLLVIGGIILIKTQGTPDGMMKPLPYIMIGIGCGVFGGGMGSLLGRGALKNSQHITNQLAIDIHDERNVTISSRAKSKAYDMMIFFLGLLILCFAMLKIDVVAILLLGFAYLFMIGYGIYYRFKYDKEM